MLKENQKVAIYMQDSLGTEYGKMGYGVMRYIANPVVCVIDSRHSGSTVRQICNLPFDIPVVDSIERAHALGSDVVITGTAPSGGRIPADWLPELAKALSLGMSIVNGLHDSLNEIFASELTRRKSQFIWDVRIPTFTPGIASAQAASLSNLRVLMVGTDMAIGKMTSGLELFRWSQQHNYSSAFVATGQIGITITGRGIPLDAFKVDHACGAVESAVMREQDKQLIFIEGQGSLLHPGSSATLPLMRGSCANRLIMCHRAGMTRLREPHKITLPPLREFIQLNELVAGACGSLTKAKTVGVSLNTSHLTDTQAQQEIQNLESELGIPVQDPVRYGCEKLGQAILQP